MSPPHFPKKERIFVYFRLIGAMKPSSRHNAPRYASLSQGCHGGAAVPQLYRIGTICEWLDLSFMGYKFASKKKCT